MKISGYFGVFRFLEVKMFFWGWTFVEFSRVLVFWVQNAPRQQGFWIERRVTVRVCSIDVV